MKILFNLFFCLFLFVSSNVCSQHASAIKLSAIEMGNALVQKNTKKFISYMHPVMIKLAGGENKLRMISDSAINVFEQFGGKVSKINFGNPSEVVNHKNLLQAVIPQTMTLTSFFADIELATNLIAISGDGGKSWQFIDTNLFNLEQIKTALPEISSTLVIPKSTPPRINMK